MVRLFAHEDRFLVWQVKQLLDEKGIPCFIKNEYAIGAMGDLSPFDCLPEVWLTDDEWLPKATEFVYRLHEQPSLLQDWFCRQCGEENAGSFELCWRCGREPSHS
ncbi:DUF2007 domain-containing protein [Aliiglaciecola sp. CAU 1673]|uniref:putative signal transducing protein n=1 Tax=Aliiglaciecola sp. CAU 1673 TaxID=3032595 RepID=UPI0023DC3A31|nr:DUF2007 domain-containing protein [Aliiglaciecola sp. CAU 1673]MDF2179496.1 DUF2007 domain-containing protein [Aliiglaciecola sp. CAU 1673]